MRKFLRYIIILVLAFTVFMAQISYARVGSGRTFGNRGSRGFSPYSNSRTSPFRTYDPSINARPQMGQTHIPPYSSPTSPTSGASPFLRSMGAGLAGGFLGSLLFRSFGGPSTIGYPHATGGIGILELLLLAGLIFLVFRLLTNRSQPSATYPNSGSTADGGAEALIKKAKTQNWSMGPLSKSDPSVETQRYYSDNLSSNSIAISTELAMDLFFQIQGAWKNRTLDSVLHLLDDTAKLFLQEELAKLKASHKINCLENIAVRHTEIVESWLEEGMNYSTVKISANLLDYTIDERTQEVIEGSRTSPIKFEENWTFVKDTQNPQWRLSAIQQI